MKTATIIGVALLALASLAVAFVPSATPLSSSLRTKVSSSKAPPARVAGDFAARQQLVLQAAADGADEEKDKAVAPKPAPKRQAPVSPQLSDSMRQKLLNEARSQGADENFSTGNPILLISIVIAVLVILGGKGFFF